MHRHIFRVIAIAIAGARLHAATHGVTLTWTDTSNPSGSTYNVYRAAVACPAGGGIAGVTFTKIGSAVPLSPYSDANVTAGQTYCYYLTTVGTPESGPSATAQAVIPTAFPPGQIIIIIQ